MKAILTRFAGAAAALSASTAPLYAQSWNWWSWFGGHSSNNHGGVTPAPRAVPEIDASAGILAVAAVVAIMVFVWERRRRAA